MLPVIDKGKAAIVIASPHANSVSGVVKCNQWGQYQIQCSGFNAPVVNSFRFRNTVTIVNEAVARRIGGKPQTVVRESDKYRQVEGFAKRAKAFDEWLGVNFPISGEIDGNMPAVHYQRVPA